MTTFRNIPGPLKRLAAPLVITVAMVPGCKGQDPKEPSCQPPDCHMNPPGVEPPAAPTVDVTSTTTPPPEVPVPTATAAVPEPTTVPTSTPDAPELPDAPPGVTVQRFGERCYYQPAANCPPFDPKRPITCNPPGQITVKCP